MENCFKGLKYALSGHMEIYPYVLQDISPLGPLPCSHSTSSAITPCRASDTADHVPSLDDLLLFSLFFCFFVLPGIKTGRPIPTPTSLALCPSLPFLSETGRWPMACRPNFRMFGVSSTPHRPINCFNRGLNDRMSDRPFDVQAQPLDKSSKDSIWSAVPNTLLGVISRF